MKQRVITLAGKEYELRYDLYGRRDVEQKLGKGLWEAFSDGQIESVATILWAGMKHAHKRHFTPADVLDLLQAECDADGEFDKALKVAMRAMFDKRLFGRDQDPKAIERLLGPEDEDEEGKAEPPATVRAAE